MPCRAGRGRLASYGSPLRQREAALLRHALVVRRESSDHAPQDPNAILTTFEARVTDLLRCWCGRAWPTSWREAHSALAHNTTTPSPYCAARALRAVGRYSTGRKARAPRATGFERDDHDYSKPMPPACCGVGSVEPRPTARRGSMFGHCQYRKLLACACARPLLLLRHERV